MNGVKNEEPSKTGFCLCGCGTATRGHWASGHDMRMALRILPPEQYGMSGPIAASKLEQWHGSVAAAALFHSSAMKGVG